MEGTLLVVGHHSYLGGYFTEYARSRYPALISLSSKDCNFLNREEVLRFFQSTGRDPLTVMFFAAINKSAENSFTSFTGNVQMVRNLIEGAALANIQSLVYFSSVDVYGSHPELPITEESRIAPDTWYGLAKYCCEWMLLNAEQINYPVTVLRIPGIYGPAPGDKSVIGKMVASIRAEKRIYVRGDGTALRDLVYLGDLCRILEALIPLRCRQIVNVATGQSQSIMEIAELVGAVLQEEFRIQRRLADSERDFNLVFDTGALSSLIPGFRFTSLESGIRTYIGGQSPER